MTEKTNPTDRLERLAAALGGRYRVEHEIGSGGMATVYAAHDLRHDREVAIKVLQPDVASSIGADRFLGEIRTTARLNHPNILPLFDSGDADGLLFFVMPLVVGETLRKRMDRESPLPLDEVVSIGTDLCSALDHAHRQGVIHRDIKPENILLQDGRAVLADFGIALAARPDDVRLTGSGLAIGTPAYMSPEQVLGERALDARSDIYAVGTVLYEMLAGTPPFTGPTMQAVVAKTLTEPPLPPSRHRRDVPANLDSAVLSALEKDPARRPATAAELRSELTAGAHGKSPPVDRRHRIRMLLTAVATVAVVAIGLVFATWKRASAASPVIAIFPFTNITGDTTNTPLGQGLPLAIFDALRPLHLDVIPVETSSELIRQYANDDATSLGKKLHASAMLLGKFERDGGRVRIHVQLIDVAHGGVLWSNQFNGTANLFDLEDSVAMAVANAMRVTLDANQRASLRAVPTVNPEVHRVVVRALGYIERRDGESMHAGVDLLHEALAMDSTYAPAWAALGRAYLLIGVYGDSASEHSFIAADSAVDHALRLDDNLAGAHLTRAVLDVFYHHDYQPAAAEFQRSLALDPTDASTRLFRSWYYLAVDKPDSAVISIRLARQLDPNSPIIRAREGTVLYYTGHLSEAASTLENALVADTGNSFARRQLQLVYADLGRCDEVRRLDPKIRAILEQYENSYAWYSRAQCGDTARVRKFTDALEAREVQGGYVDPYALARVYKALGDTTRMWSWLQRARETGPWEMWGIDGDPAFSQIRNDPRFKAVAEHVQRH